MRSDSLINGLDFGFLESRLIYFLGKIRLFPDKIMYNWLVYISAMPDCEFV